MDRLEAMRIFIAVLDSGSLAAAARGLGRSPALVTRAVAQMETMAGGRLLERTTRRFAVTELGTHHAAIYRRMLGELSQLDTGQLTPQITGSVVVTAPELFGRMKVLPVVESFLSAYPRTQVRLLLVNRLVDLIGEGVDVAIRIADLPDTSMHAIKVGEVRRLTCAAPHYLSKHGSPTHPKDLQNHWCLGLNDVGVHELWPYREHGPNGRVRSVRVTCRLALNHAGASIEASERSMGLVRPLSYQVEQQLKHKSLVTVLEEYELDPVPAQIVFQSRRHQSPAVQTFIDHAVPLLRRELRSHLSRDPEVPSEQADNGLPE